MTTMTSLRNQLHELKGFQTAVRNSGISISHAEALQRAVVTHQPQLVVEIGMAYGASTLAILSALRYLDNGGKLISIDPYQHQLAHGHGVEHVRLNGLSELHTLIEKPDYVALPELLNQNSVVNFAYIDGWHTFDYTLLDFFYIDKLLPVGGIVGFNDCGLLAVTKVLRFLKTHRKYSEVDVGLKKEYKGRNIFYSAARHLLRLSNTDQYFRKEAKWEPRWNFYARF